MWIRALGALGLLLALCVLFVPAWVFWNSRDLAAIGDADLRPLVREIASERNAFTHMLAATDLLVGLEDRKAELSEALRSDRAAREALAPLLAENAAALDALDAVFAAPEFQIPIPASFDEEVPDYSNWQKIARLLSLRGLLAPPGSQQGLQDLFRSLELARRLERAEGAGLLGVMVALSMRTSASDAFRTWIGESSISREEALALATRLEPHRTDATAWRKMWGVEYEMMRSGVLPELEKSRNGEDGETEPGRWAELVLRYYIHPNRTMSAFAEHYRVEASNADRPCSQLVATSVERPSNRRIMLSPNGAGLVIHSITGLEAARYQHRRCASDTRIGVVQVTAALRAWQLDRATFPESLDALVPDYLAAVPADAFDGLPLRWSREHEWLYSVGSDFVDAGGKELEPTSTDLTEPTWPVRFAASETAAAS